MPMWVRIGMHWGCPRRRGDDIVGRDVNLAARISELAGPARCCARRRPRTQAGEVAGVEFEPLGPVFVRGIADAVPLDARVDLVVVATGASAGLVRHRVGAGDGPVGSR